jgi:hypothetical protein
LNYSSRLTCFIDVLGFKSVIENSLSDPKITDELFELISELQPKNITDAIYKAIPHFSFTDGKTAVNPSDPKTTSEIWPIEITQFSDSFVLSCPSDNYGSCVLLIEAIFLLHFMFYRRLGLLVRGGLTVGSLVHHSNSVVFGPALNEAYRLESKMAIYPRVIVDKKKFDELNEILRKHQLLSFFSEEDDFFTINLTTLTKWHRTEKMISLQEIVDFSYQSKKHHSNNHDILKKYQYLHNAAQI